MKDLFVNYNQASELKELGFDESCLAVFNDSKQFRINSESRNWNDNVKNGNTTSAPTFPQAFRFFRKNYDLFCGILTECSYGGELHAYHITGVNQGDISKGDFYSYETAESASLDKLIEIIKTK